MKKLSWFDKLVFIVNTLAAVGLIIVYFLPYIPPKKFALISVLTLGVPLLILTNLAFAAYWIIRLKKQFLLSFILLLLGYNTIGKFYQLPFKDENKKGEYSLMNYNVRMFNHSKWTEEDSIPEKINAVVREVNPDILTVEEYYENKELVAYYPYHYINYRQEKSGFGQAIFSKYEILKKESIDFKGIKNATENNNSIFVDILIDKDTVRVYNIHFQSLNVTEDIQEVDNFKNKSESKKIVKNISKGFVRQNYQSEKFLKSLQACKYPVIISGDFNNTAFSYTYQQVRDDRFTDAYVEKGMGFGSTYNLNYFPLRIDFHLLDTIYKVDSYDRIKVNYSDHYPIYTTFSKKKSTN
ncbi:endonuclease/exonuclease/phosphatase family protein [Zunongwangia sp.]|uniref:endonuclease/exonuclease/phosphatase family protein n=1 Tax=Zunongwangia sp. TaxID=1965325 RepID=UPI003AA898C6